MFSYALSLHQCLDDPLKPFFRLLVELLQVGNQLVRKEHLHIGMGLVLLHEGQNHSRDLERWQGGKALEGKDLGVNGKIRRCDDRPDS